MTNGGIEADFPRLTEEGYGVISPCTPQYNCIAWAADDDTKWWWPTVGTNAYWPSNVPDELTVGAFVQAYRSLGYVACVDGLLEPGYEKVAIFADDHGEPTHAARQRRNGTWTSKLGEGHDIDHALMGVAGTMYGQPVVYLRRPLRPEPD